MNCPFCSGELQQKFIESTHVMYLVDDLHPFMGPVVAQGKIRLTEFMRTGIPAMYCPKCKKAICDLDL